MVSLSEADEHLLERAGLCRDVVPRLVDGLVRMVLYLEGVKMEGVEMRCGRWEELWIWALGLGLRHLVWVWVLVL